jgi:hypothetical protein
VRDDETEPSARSAAAEEFRRASGPRHAAARHAAPRKSLLTKFHMPAGKAMMFAAMPTAVVVGMGLTPRLALADTGTKAPNPNPCVSRSDEPDTSDSPSPSASASGKPDPSASAGPHASTSPGGGKGDDGTKPGGGSTDPKPSATSSTSPSASHTPDPAHSSAPPSGGDSGGDGGGGLLGGLGSAVGGLLGVHDKTSSSPAPSNTPAPDPKPTTSAPAASGSSASHAPSKSGSPLGSVLGGSSSKTSDDGGGTKAGSGSSDKDGGASKGASADPTGKAVKGTVSGLSKAKASTAEAKTQAIRDLLTQKGVQFSDAAADPKEAGAKADGGSCDDGPCDNLIPVLKPPTQDADAPPMATDPWHLASSNLGLKGLCYRGLVDITTPSGVTKRVMKFTADSISIADLHQTVDNRDANGNIVTHSQIETKPGSTSTIDGPVTMYTEKLSGNLLGLLPITFTPDFPPPIQIPSVFFTNAEVDQAGQFGGTLSMKGLHSFIG